MEKEHTNAVAKYLVPEAHTDVLTGSLWETDESGY